jgi:hypothetical protein
MNILTTENNVVASFDGMNEKVAFEIEDSAAAGPRLRDQINQIGSFWKPQDTILDPAKDEGAAVDKMNEQDQFC